VRTIDTGFTLSLYQWRGAWGERQTGTLQTGKGYCANLGHQEDETGLIYMRARYYEPTTGRFISEDPARDGVNWYLYADGNPVNKGDYTGKAADWLLIVGGLSFVLSFIANEIGASHPLTKTLKSLLSETARAISATTLVIRLGSRDSKVAAAASALLAGVGMIIAIAAIHQFVLAIVIIGMEMGWLDYPTSVIEREAGWRYLDRAERIWDFFSS